jgi:7-carboxy-7-deazaguanine synthase
MIVISEIFGPTIQGEGKYTGHPSVFIRLNGCNLRCCFAGGSVCDTPYTSHCAEQGKLMAIEDICQEIIERLDGSETTHLVFTGGEPMLQQEELQKLFRLLQDKKVFNPITIETNGTIIPNQWLLGHDILWSVSPKLSTSCCFEGTDVSPLMQELHKTKRINIAALAAIAKRTKNYQFKFVYSGEDSVKEIKQILNQIKDAIFGISNTWLGDIENHVMLMPEGANIEQLEATSEQAVKACIENGWTFSDRLHIRIWNDKRAV